MARSSGSIPSTPAPRRRRGSRRTPIRPGPPALPRRPPQRTACACTALFGNGDIAAFDLAGKQLWARNLGYPDSGYGISASLVAWQGRVIVQYDQAGGKSALIALEGATGEKAWSTPRPVEDSWPSPILIDIGGQKQLVTSARPLTIAYDPATGAELWRTDTSLGADLAPSPAFGGGVVLVCGKPIAQDAKVVAIGAGGSKPGQILWTSTVLAGDVSSPVFTGEGFLVVHSNEGEQIGTLAYYPTQSPTANAKPLWTEAPAKTPPGSRRFTPRRSSPTDACICSTATGCAGFSKPGRSTNSSPSAIWASRATPLPRSSMAGFTSAAKRTSTALSGRANDPGPVIHCHRRGRARASAESAVPILQAIQEHYGYLPCEALERVCEA